MGHRRFPASTALYILAVATITLLSGCNAPPLTSVWQNNDIVVDGTDTEWQDVRQYYDEKTRTVVGVINNVQHLYLRVATSDRSMKTALQRQGLIVWFDPAGGKEKRFGLQFPVTGTGMGSHGGTPPKSSYLLSEPPRPARSGRNKVALLGPGENRQSILPQDDVEAAGIRLAMGSNAGPVVLEMAVPLAQTASTPFAVDATPGATIGIGLMTSAGGDMKKGPGGKKTDDQRGQGPGRGKGGGQKDKGPAATQPFEQWFTLHLATAAGDG